MAGLDMFAGIQADIGNKLREGGATAQAYAERIIARLDSIDRGITSLQNPENERTVVSAAIDANDDEVLVEGRPGYMLAIEHVAITADGETDIDIFVGSLSDNGFRLRYQFAQAGRDQDGPMELEVPQGAPIFAQVTGDYGARVNVQIQRKRAE